MKKFLTWQEYLEKLDSFQEAYENYYELYDELQRKDNIINKIKKALKDHKEIKNKTNTKEYYIEVDEVLDYIKELESK